MILFDFYPIIAIIKILFKALCHRQTAI